jgi:hypothetical protein
LSTHNSHISSKISGTFEYANFLDGCYKFDGMWKKDKRQAGKFFLRNGEIWTGTFENKLSRASIIFDNNSTFAYYNGSLLNKKR